MRVKKRQGAERKKELIRNTREEVVEFIQEHGLKVTPIGLEKNPYFDDWTNPEVYEPMQEKWIQQFLNKEISIGIMGGVKCKNGLYLAILDVDSEPVYKVVKEYETKTTVVRSGGERERGDKPDISKKISRHLYFFTKVPTKSIRKHTDNVEFDLIGVGCQTCSPMYIHPKTKREYRFLNKLPPMVWNGDLIFDLKHMIQETLGVNVGEVEKVPINELLCGGMREHDGRDMAAIRIATWYRTQGKNEEETLKLLCEWNQKNIEPLEEAVLEVKVSSAFKPEEPYKFNFVETEVFDEKTLAEANKLLNQEDITPFIEGALGEIVGETNLKTFLVILNAARQSVQIWGDTASGKNTVVDYVMKCFPKDSYFKVTGATDKSIRYLGEDIKTLYLVEFKAVRSKPGEESTAEYDVKLSISEEEGLCIIVVEKDPETGKLKTVKIKTHLENVITTNTDPEISDELRNRVWEACTDASINFPVRDRIINETVTFKENRINCENQRKILRCAMDIMQKEAPKEFIIPYMPELTAILCHNVPRVRRDTKKLKKAIEAVAKLHYRTRPHAKLPNGVEHVVSHPLDFALAWKYGADIIMGTFTGETEWFKNAMRVAFEILKSKKVLDTNTFAYMLGCNYRNGNKWLKRFSDGGILLKKQVNIKSGGRKFVYSSPAMDSESGIIEIETKKLTDSTKQWLEKNKKYVDWSFGSLEDEMTKKLPAKLTCTIRTTKRPNVNDLPDAEVELEDLDAS